MKAEVKRFWEVDFLRGLAVILMISYHAIYDLAYFRTFHVDMSTSFWFILPRMIASTFILLAGASLALSYSRARETLTGNRLLVKYLRRGAWIFSWGLLVTAVTWIFIRQDYVSFGILHFVGVSIILAYPFLRMRYAGLALGVLFIALGMLLQNVYIDSPWLVWLGITPKDFHSVDYFPLLPWFGVVLVGIFMGNTLYPDHKRRISLPDMSTDPMIASFCFIGKNSLFLYLIHQPLLIALLYALGALDISPLLSGL